MNGDGKIGVDDAQTALVAYTEQFAGNPVDLTDIQRKAVDVNRDGLLNVDDAQNILIFYTERNVAGKDIKWEDVISPKPQSLTFFKRLAAGSCMQRALLHGGHPEVRCRLRQ
ncbi:MAG: hypothetical protein IKI45_16505 [Oscillospiraceae bacterium]|nr:hypothetical protein [Oscillospiraceae bacterium]